MNSRSTIYALSSGSGRAGVAVVRVSGTGCSDVVKHIVGDVPKPREAVLRTLRDPVDNNAIDKGLVIFFPGPTSVTGEDVAEFHVHGSSAVVAKLLSVLSRYADLAEPGAFTRRAFENGKMDLLEVEGLADLLQSDSEPQRKLAMRHFLGEASTIYESWRAQVITAVAMVEAAIDFNDEAGVEQAALESVRPAIKKLIADIECALEKAGRASMVRTGLRIVIGGPPNAGKSSLMNSLVDRDAAIVSAVAGTTRDVIEAASMFAGLPVVLRDTAGLRAMASDDIEAAGIARAEEAMRDADVLVWVTSPDTEPDSSPPRTPNVNVFNKIDLVSEKSIHVRNESKAAPLCHVSTRTGEGMLELRQVLERVAAQSYQGLDQAVVVRERHRFALEKCLLSLRSSLSDCEPVEVVAEHLRLAVRCVESVSGRVDVEDYLGAIFSTFCIGK